MAEMINIPNDELTRIKERARKSAMDKSYLQLVIRLMNSVGSATWVWWSARTWLRPTAGGSRWRANLEKGQLLW